MKKDVEAIISYWRDPGDGSLPDPEHDAEIFLGHHDEENRKMHITDIRGAESSYALDINGFEVHTIPVKERDWENEEIVKTEYFDEVSDLVRRITGAKDVIVFTNALRGLARGSLKPREFGGKKIQAPSPRPHVDFSPENAVEFVRGRIGSAGPGAPSAAEVSEMISNAPRWQVLGIWKPLKTIERDPLVLIDSRSVPDSDYCDLVRDKTAKLMEREMKWVLSMLKLGSEEEQHRWHYLSDMKPEEVLVFKHFDSKRDLPAWRCAHTSIELPGTEELPARQSIDVRALICY